MKNKIISLLLFILFIILGIIALNGYTTNLDNCVYFFIINFKNNLMTSIFKTISFMFSPPMVIFYCSLFFISIKDKYKSSFITFMMIIQSIFTNIIKVIFKRKRPNINPLVIEKTYSFPSGHTMASIILIVLLGYLVNELFSKKYKNIIICIEILIISLVGISRIYLGVHYFTDILGACLLSTSILFFIKEDNHIKKYLEKSKEK